MRRIEDPQKAGRQPEGSRIRAFECLAALALVACGSANSVVGGDCATGYVDKGNHCVPALTNEGPDGGFTTDDAASGDGSHASRDASADGEQLPNNVGPNFNDDGGTSCVPPTIACAGQCIDPTSDPNNCGSCGKVCPSNSCVAGQCVGSAPGHVVFVGHDYLTSPTVGSSQARVLSNAVLLPASNPLRVLSYEQYADATAVKNAEALVSAAAKQLGRTVNFTPTSSDAYVANSVDINTYDVLLVHDQRSAQGSTLGTVGSEWQTSNKLDGFLHAGGVVVVLDGGGGAAHMPDLLTSSGMLAVSSQTNVTGALTVLAPADAVGSGVVSPYIPKPSTVCIATEAAGGDVVYVVGQSGAPIVVHKVMP